MKLDDLLRTAVSRGASDLHLKVGAYPMMRVSGSLLPVNEEKRLDHLETLTMGTGIMTPAQQKKFEEVQEVDLAYSLPGLGRFR